MTHTKVHTRHVVATRCCALNMVHSDIRGFIFALTAGTQSGLMLLISIRSRAVQAGMLEIKKNVENKGFQRQLMSFASAD